MIVRQQHSERNQPTLEEMEVFGKKVSKKTGGAISCYEAHLVEIIHKELACEGIPWCTGRSGNY